MSDTPFSTNASISTALGSQNANEVLQRLLAEKESLKCCLESKKCKLKIEHSGPLSLTTHLSYIWNESEAKFKFALRNRQRSLIFPQVVPRINKKKIKVHPNGTLTEILLKANAIKEHGQNNELKETVFVKKQFNICTTCELPRP